jgi:hypothetical protein
MKISPQDQPKAIAAVVGIGICLVFIGSTLMKNKSEQAKEPKTEVASFVAGKPVETAALEPKADPMEYVKNIQQWSQPPDAPQGDPFREVLPKDLAARLRNKVPVSRPAPQITGTGFGGNTALNPTLPGAKAMIDFPDVKVQGVIVDSSDGTPTNFAVLEIDNKVSYAKAGDVIGNGMKVDKVTELGVWITAAKEHAFIEIDKSYKPNGMAPPEPPKAASHSRRSHRSRRT